MEDIVKLLKSIGVSYKKINGKKVITNIYIKQNLRKKQR